MKIPSLYLEEQLNVRFPYKIAALIDHRAAAFKPGPYTSTYFASKSFVLGYIRAIRYEAKKKGVNVCTVCPGATRTNFFSSEGVKTPRYAMQAEVVAGKIYRQLMRNKAVLIPGLRNKIMNIFPVPVKMVVVSKVKG